MYVALLRKIIFFLLALFLFAAPGWAQWATPVIDGTITTGEYGSNNSLSNAGNTGQTWYMTWDANNLYVGIVNANLVGRCGDLHCGQSAEPAHVLHQRRRQPHRFQLRRNQLFVVALPRQVRYLRQRRLSRVPQLRRQRRLDRSDIGLRRIRDNSGNQNTREVAIPWSAITSNGGIPSSFVFFGYLTSPDGYVYGQVPTDNNIGGFVGTSASATQYYAIDNTGNGTSTPPFSNEQPAGFSGADKAGFYHNTFDPFYRDQEGAVPENSQVTLRFRTLHSSGIWGVTARAYLFDTATGVTTGPVDTSMPFDQNITINGTEYDVWKTTLTMPSTTTVYYYKFKINRDQTNGWYSDDYLDDNDNVHKDGTGAATDGEPFPSFQFTVYDPNFQTPTWLQNANVYHIMPDRFRNGDQTNDYCRPGSTTGCPIYYGKPAGVHLQSVEHADLRSAQPEFRLLQPVQQPVLRRRFVWRAERAGLHPVARHRHHLHEPDLLGAFVSPLRHRQLSAHRSGAGRRSGVRLAPTELHRRGMQVILDGVFNHASSDGMYFDRYDRYGVTIPNTGACLSLGSQWRTWFNFTDSNVPCQTADYIGWFGLDSLPTFNHGIDGVKDFFYRGNDNVTQHWYAQGASGWRFDVADDGNFPHAWWVDYRNYAKTYNGNGPLIGEIWPNASQWLAGDQMDSVMNYRFRKNITGFVRNAEWHDDNNNGTNDIPGLSPSQFDNAIRAVRDDYPPQATAAMLNLLDSHDVNRALYVMTELATLDWCRPSSGLKWRRCSSSPISALPWCITATKSR